MAIQLWRYDFDSLAACLLGRNYDFLFSPGGDLITVKRDLNAPVSLNVYGDYVYWYDIVTQEIRRVSKIDPSDEAIIQRHISSMVNLVVYHTSRQMGTTALQMIALQMIV